MFMNVAERRSITCDFATRSFRDVADQDYILARAAFKMRLHLQFITLGHQALERYLKAILLYNDISSKGLGHSLSRAYAKVLKLEYLEISMPVEVPAFLERLDQQASRYFEYSFGSTGRTVEALDRAVWHIRRYCKDMHLLERQPDGSFTEELRVDLDRINSPRYASQPHLFRHFFGFLEEVLDGKHAELHPALVWHNAFYSTYRRTLPNFGSSYSANPTLTLHPEAFEYLDGLVSFSKGLRDRFKISGA